MYDVVIIGGGPVGSYVAYKLSEKGHNVVVLEKKEKLGGRVCCTGIISQECVNSFAIEDGVIWRWVGSVQLFPPSGSSLRLWRKETQACIVNRSAFDILMAQRAQAEGAHYVLGSRVEDIEIGKDGAKIEAVGQGERLNFEGRAVVIAAGFGSGLTERVGLDRIGDFVMGAQAEVEVNGVDEVEVYFSQEVAPGFFAWLVPTSPPKALAGLASHRRSGFYLRKLMSSLVAQGKIVSAEVEPSYRAIPLKPLPKTCGQRLVVVGDAAGQVKPTTGGGIYYGLLCADIAADSLHRALDNNDLSARSLAGYECGWKKRLGRELKICYYARKFYERLSDRQIEKLFDIIKSRGIDKALLKRDDLAFDWHGEVILKLLRQGILSKAIEMMKTPFRIGV
ncbi:geranylgeranyl reductase family protein [Chloroflexota bacterium]